MLRARPGTRPTAAGEFKVHDLENLGDHEMIFNTIEFLDSANKPLPVPDRVRLSGSCGDSTAGHNRTCHSGQAIAPSRTRSFADWND